MNFSSTHLTDGSYAVHCGISYLHTLPITAITTITLIITGARFYHFVE